MAGKTTIDTDLRNEVVEFLRHLGAQDTEPVGLITAKAKAMELYWQLKPQRTRGHRPMKEVATVENIQPSQ